MSANGGLTPGDPLGAVGDVDAIGGTPARRPDSPEAPAAGAASGEGARAAGVAGAGATALPRESVGVAGDEDPDRAGLDFSGRPVVDPVPAPDFAPGYAAPASGASAGFASPVSDTAHGYASPPPAGALRPPAGAFGGVPSGLGTSGGGQYVLAGWWRRVGATLIDAVIIGVGALLIYLVFGSIFSVGFFASDETGAVSLVVGLLLATVAVTIVALAYAPLLMTRTNGKTIGRMATGIRVVRASGEPMTFGVAMLREVAIKALAFGVAGSFTFGIANLLDYLWPLWDEENRALHDFPVQTRTVMD